MRAVAIHKIVAIWPEIWVARMYSGVPNAGAPLLMSTLEVNEPYMTGIPD